MRDEWFIPVLLVTPFIALGGALISAHLRHPW
jgi:hypothetical protein